MPWMKVDDNLHAHRKPRKAGVPAMGLWVLAGSWACNMLSDGFVPDYIAQSIDPEAETHADALVRAGLWEEAEQDGDTGWRFIGWDEYQPMRSEVEKKREDARERMARVRGKRAPSSDDVRANSERTSQSVRLTPTRPDPTPNTRASSDDAFERFWAVYPRKVAKKAAKAKWDTAIKTNDPEAIINGATTYAKKCQAERTEKKFIKQPDGWLNAGRWEDEIEVTTVPVKFDPWNPEAYSA